MGYKTLQDFPTEMFDVWELAAKGKLNFVFPNKGMAVNFRQQLHSFRKKLRSQSVELAVKYDRTELSLIPQSDGSSWAVSSGLSIWKKQLQEQLLKAQEEEANDKPT